MDSTEHLESKTYYFEIGAGMWTGAFTFRITDWQAFWKVRLGFWNRVLCLSMHFLQAILGEARITSALEAHDAWGPVGVATNRVRILKLGITMYVLDEQYVLDPDGISVHVHSTERFGPLPFLFTSRKHHPARIAEGGLQATYLDMPLLGDVWVGHYEVQSGQNAVDARLSCAWAEAHEMIQRTQSSALRPTPPPRAELDSVGRVIARLDSYLQWYDATRDRRAVFTHAYTIITRDFDAAIRGGVFSEPGWVAALDVAFAKEFFSAMDASALGRSVPRGWRRAVRALDERKTSVVEDLVFPMIAHVVHDLPLALGKLAQSSPQAKLHIGDFHLANDVLQKAIPKIQEETARRYNPILRYLDRLGGREDEILTNYGIRLGRAAAWYNAERWSDPNAGREAQKSIGRSASQAVGQILRPPLHSSRFALRLLRLATRSTRRWPRARPPGGNLPTLPTR